MDGINDHYYPGSLNFANSSERYMFTYNKLEHLSRGGYLNQIDTVFLEFAPTDTWENTDGKYFDESETNFYIPAYFPLLSKEERKIYKGHEILYLKKIIGHLHKQDIKQIYSSNDGLGGFHYETAVFDPNKMEPKMKDTGDGDYWNLHYLDKIIKLCKERNIKLFFIYMPMNNPEIYYDQSHYYEVYKKNYKHIPLLDFSHLPVPNHFRKDNNHLNGQGATWFTKYFYSIKKQEGYQSWN